MTAVYPPDHHLLRVETEAPHIDHRFVPDVQVVHPARPVDRKPIGAGPHHRNRPTVLVGELTESHCDA